MKYLPIFRPKIAVSAGYSTGYTAHPGLGETGGKNSEQTGVLGPIHGRVDFGGFAG